MEPEFNPIINDASVISFKTGTFKLSDLMEMLEAFGQNQAYLITDHIAEKGKGRIPRDNLFSQGVEAELLEPGQSEWVKGKVRLKFVVEFGPGEFQEEPKPSSTSPTRLHRQVYTPEYSEDSSWPPRDV